MHIEDYTKIEEGARIASFSVVIPEWGLKIRNLSIIKKKDGGRFISLPNYYNEETKTWTKITEFDKKETNDRFMKALYEAVKEYEKK